MRRRHSATLTPWTLFAIVNLGCVLGDLYAVVVIPGHAYFLVFLATNLAMVVIGVDEGRREMKDRKQEK